MTKEINLDELKELFEEKAREDWETASFDNDTLVESFAEILKEQGIELDEDAWGDTYNSVRDFLKDPFYLSPIDECLAQHGVDPTPEQYVVAEDCVYYLNFMLANGCYVGEFVLEEYIAEKYPNVDAEVITTLVSF